MARWYLLMRRDRISLPAARVPLPPSSMRMQPRPIVGALSIGFLAVVALPGCHKPPPSVVKSKEPEVEIEKPTIREVTDHEDFTGHIEAIPTVDLRAQVTGYLKSAHFREGTDVKKGDLLFEIDSIVYDAQLTREGARHAGRGPLRSTDQRL